MRWIGVAILLGLLSAALPGCSALIAKSGIDMGDLECRNDVVRRFGKPRMVETDLHGTVETYRSRRKISDPIRAQGHTMEFAMLFGITEPRNLFLESIRYSRDRLLGQEVIFAYDDSGQIVGFSTDATWLGSGPAVTDPGNSPAASGIDEESLDGEMRTAGSES